MKHTHANQTQIVKLLTVLAVAGAETHEKDREVQPLRIERRIVVSIPDRKLALVDRDAQGRDRIVKVYDIAVGKPSTPSPRGQFAVVNRIPNPTWYGPQKVVAPGAANPLGTRWMGLSAAGYGIHGTNVPRSIGKAASHGCIRMRNQDVEDLFDRVTDGIAVELSAERPFLLAQVFAVASVLAD